MATDAGRPDARPRGRRPTALGLDRRAAVRMGHLTSAFDHFESRPPSRAAPDRRTGAARREVARAQDGPRPDRAEERCRENAGRVCAALGRLGCGPGAECFPERRAGRGRDSVASRLADRRLRVGSDQPRMSASARRLLLSGPTFHGQDAPTAAVGDPPPSGHWHATGLAAGSDLALCPTNFWSRR